MYRKILNNNKIYNKLTYSSLNSNKRLSIRFQNKRKKLVNLEKFIKKKYNLFKKHY